ncbi:MULTISPECIES: hypothetical protein [unclassified Rathayibacter]|jgi:hypothetical protein|uniref:hypothetical protein n=1 Tax=unclassified Rathayibacter TaxID=2609250 RepID=UPI0015E2D2CE|nr:MULTISPECIES: hypothetical protein [unclassified Rathayibacter]
MSDEPDGTDAPETLTGSTSSTRGPRSESPKQRYLDQLIAEDYDSMGEGARREMLED